LLSLRRHAPNATTKNKPTPQPTATGGMALNAFLRFRFGMALLNMVIGAIFLFLLALRYAYRQLTNEEEVASLTVEEMLDRDLNVSLNVEYLEVIGIYITYFVIALSLNPIRGDK
jgi:hypothetical protein